MEKRRPTTKCFPAIIVLMTFFQSSYGIEDRKIPQGCNWIEMNSGSFCSAVEKVISKVDLNSWPQSNLLKVAKISDISNLLQTNPNLAKEKSVGFSGMRGIYFAGNSWTECEWIRRSEKGTMGPRT